MVKIMMKEAVITLPMEQALWSMPETRKELVQELAIHQTIQAGEVLPVECGHPDAIPRGTVRPRAQGV